MFPLLVITLKMTQLAPLTVYFAVRSWQNNKMIKYNEFQYKIEYKHN